MFSTHNVNNAIANPMKSLQLPLLVGSGPNLRCSTFVQNSDGHADQAQCRESQ
jgi:hypothetical protein